ncbi:carboxypeptidase B-like [Folsomia candida]|uniref:carboxypeptidase B-like n=1 Tax=Folsomia candida TaxID=158441 RepID=UPI001604AB20|nr:carboxypeptidase B-like [Folsomia candida]
MKSFNCLEVGILISFLFFLSFVDGNPKFMSPEKRHEFSGFKLYQVSTRSNEGLKVLRDLWEEQDSEDEGFDFWSPPKIDENGTAEVMVPKNQESDFQNLLNSFSMNYSVVIDDIERLVAKQYAGMFREKSMSWTEYHYPETLFSFLTNLVSTRNGLYVNTSTIGLTVERRPIKLIKISSGGPGKQAVFIDGGIHAREWISSAVSTYIVNELVHNSTKYEDLLRRFDFYIIPLLNPDGYAHSCNYNRLWRKSRKANDLFFGLIGCRGVDLNRNFGYSWGGRGSGRQPCSLIYAGPQEFSEPETAAIRDFIASDENADIDWTAYFTLHSFGQKWLSPWGHTSVLPEDYSEMERVGRIGIKALRAVHGTRYSFGSTANTLYIASGSSMDWWKGVVGVPYSYTLELRDYGLFGFLLPAYQIIPTAEETWAGIQASLLAIPEKKN